MGSKIDPRDGRPRLLDLIDQTDGLREAMTPNVVYSLADRDCQRCLEGRRQPPGRSVALVMLENHPRQPKGRLVTLCDEHAKAWERNGSD